MKKLSSSRRAIRWLLLAGGMIVSAGSTTEASQLMVDPGLGINVVTVRAKRSSGLSAGVEHNAQRHSLQSKRQGSKPLPIEIQIYPPEDLYTFSHATDVVGSVFDGKSISDFYDPSDPSSIDGSDHAWEFPWHWLIDIFVLPEMVSWAKNGVEHLYTKLGWLGSVGIGTITTVSWLVRGRAVALMGLVAAWVSGRGKVGNSGCPFSAHGVVCAGAARCLLLAALIAGCPPVNSSNPSEDAPPQTTPPVSSAPTKGSVPET